MEAEIVSFADAMIALSSVCSAPVNVAVADAPAVSVIVSSEPGEPEVRGTRLICSEPVFFVI